VQAIVRWGFPLKVTLQAPAQSGLLSDLSTATGHPKPLNLSQTGPSHPSAYIPNPG